MLGRTSFRTKSVRITTVRSSGVTISSDWRPVFKNQNGKSVNGSYNEMTNDQLNEPERHHHGYGFRISTISEI